MFLFVASTLSVSVHPFLPVMDSGCGYVCVGGGSEGEREIFCTSVTSRNVVYNSCLHAFTTSTTPQYSYPRISLIIHIQDEALVFSDHRKSVRC